MIVTQRNDNYRSGLNSTETTLTQSNVSLSTFGKVFERFVDGSVYSQPLVVQGVRNVPGHDGPVDLLFVATMHNSVYAFNATSPNVGGPVWHRNFGPSIQLPAGDVGPGGYKDIAWEVGIVSTPVIDTERGVLFVVATSRNTNGTVIHTLYRLSINNGDVTGQKQIEASFKGKTFVSAKQLQRSALTLSRANVYMAFASYGDSAPYQGWVLSYDSTTLNQVAVFVTVPNNNYGGIWQAGHGIAVDDSGNLYFMTGNGNCNPSIGDYGDSVMKLSPNLTVQGYFSPKNANTMNQYDWDLGSGGVILIPDTDLALGGGKTSELYLMNQASLGGYNTSSDNVIQEIAISADDDPIYTHHIHGTPAYYQGPTGRWIYVWPENANLKSFSLSLGPTARLAKVAESTVRDPENVPGGSRGMPGGFLSVSCNGRSAGTGILWANHPYIGDANQDIRSGILRAFDPQDITKQLWSSELNAARDDLGNFAKFCPPTILGGRVYQATMGGLQNKQRTAQTTTNSPTLANLNDQKLVVAWTGTNSELNVMASADGLSWGSGYTIPAERSSHTPGLAITPTGTAYISWTGNGSTGSLNFMSCTASGLNSWTNKHTTNEFSGHGPALAYRAPYLFVAWTGTDGHINVASTTDGGASWHTKVELNERSDTRPYIAINAAKPSLVLSWSGAGNHYLNVSECTDLGSLTFINKTIIQSQVSPNCPAVDFDMNNLPVVAWMGADSDKHLNTIVSESGELAGLVTQSTRIRTYQDDTSPSGPALCKFRGKMFMSWEGGDTNVNVGVVNRGSVCVYGLLR